MSDDLKERYRALCKKLVDQIDKNPLLESARYVWFPGMGVEDPETGKRSPRLVPIWKIREAVE